jgi:hypothetical protein
LTQESSHYLVKLGKGMEEKEIIIIIISITINLDLNLAIIDNLWVVGFIDLEFPEFPDMDMVIK